MWLTFPLQDSLPGWGLDWPLEVASKATTQTPCLSIWSKYKNNKIILLPMLTILKSSFQISNFQPTVYMSSTDGSMAEVRNE